MSIESVMFAISTSVLDWMLFITSINSKSVFFMFMAVFLNSFGADSLCRTLLDCQGENVSKMTFVTDSNKLMDRL